MAFTHQRRAMFRLRPQYGVVYCFSLVKPPHSEIFLGERQSRWDIIGVGGDGLLVHFDQLVRRRSASHQPSVADLRLRQSRHAGDQVGQDPFCIVKAVEIPQFRGDILRYPCIIGRQFRGGLEMSQRRAVVPAHASEPP